MDSYVVGYSFILMAESLNVHFFNGDIELNPYPSNMRFNSGEKKTV